MPIFIYMLVPFFEASAYALIFLFLVIGAFLFFVYAVHGTEWFEQLQELKLRNDKTPKAGLWGAYGAEIQKPKL